MSHILAIAKKELRAYFLSPVALIFLATFLFVTLFTFFWVEAFFTRNIADIRPLFSWLPILLIFLVAALTMRLWSEEQKLGTLEILMTMPVETHRLVLGKFLGGLALVALALALTLGVPITVSLLGELDWGPVFGGYLAALLLAGAYLSIGLTLSSLTDNQIVALILTVLACGFLYVVGTDPVTGLFDTRGAELLRAIGIGSRFESIGRGVIDVRDLVYYGSLIVLFLSLNTVILESKRWSEGASTRSVRTGARVMVGLALANLLVLNLWLGQSGRVRVDLTSRGEYSISKTTEGLVKGLPNPLLLRGYFSAKTHPLLAPLVPRIKDLMQEYAALSGGSVKVEFVDPRDDKDVEKEANEAYGIKSFPFRVADRYEAGVVNSYFSILVKYGDQHAVLGFDDLIEAQPSGNTVDVRLRNFEYDMTKTIKKVAYGFQTLDAMFADLKEPLELTAYITPGTLPQNYKEAPARIQAVVDELTKIGGGKFKASVVDPDATAGMREELYKKFGFRPMATSLMSQESFYLHLLLKAGDKYEQIFPSEALSEADLKNEITAAVKRHAPGFLKTVGFLKPKMTMPQDPHAMQMGQPPQTQEVTRMLEEQLGQNYTVKAVELKDGRVPGDVDVLLVGAPKNLDEKQVFAIDQYLMRGGSVIIAGGKFELNPNMGPQQGLSVEKVTSGLEAALAAYGVTIQDKLVLDPQNEAFPIPVVRDLGGLKVRDIQLMRYPFFVDVRSSGMSRDTPVTGGLPGVTLQWASPIVLSDAPAPKDGEEKPVRTVTTLLSSTPRSWSQSDTTVQPDFEKYGELGFAVEGEKKAFPLAVSIQGNFESAFKDKPSPLLEGEGDRTGRTIKRSPADARLTVVASSSFINDMVLQLSRQVAGERFTANLQLVENLIDWSVADVDLLSIRSAGTFARTLLPMEPEERALYEYANYGVVVLALGIIVALTYGRRRRLTPITLEGSRPARSGPVVGGTTEARS